MKNILKRDVNMKKMLYAAATARVSPPVPDKCQYNFMEMTIILLCNVRRDVPEKWNYFRTRH